MKTCRKHGQYKEGYMNSWPTWTHIRLPLLLSLLWCLFMLALYHRGSMEKDTHTNQLALIQARTLFEQIIDTRAWNATHGGVYVPESPYGQPNPWIPKEQRTLTLQDGKRLVLMNPAYMSRQISERTTQRGTSFRITSHVPLRPQNAADTWERQALHRCVDGAPEVFTFIDDAAGPRYRYLSALRADQSCLVCHTDNAVGDVRGGVSVTLDARPFLQAIREQTGSMVMAFSLMGLTGVLSIGGVSLLVRRKRALTEEKERMKSAFLANMSHDMRTPLTGIMGMSELLRHESVPARREQALRYLGVAGGALLEMINDITGYAALDSGQIRLVHKAFDLHQALRQCMDLFRPQCEVKGLELSLNMGEHVPQYVLGDGFRLRQVLGNLISNGVKFTEQGGVRLDVRVAGSLTPGAVPVPEAVPVRFSVKDTGMGVTNKDQARIFQRFERGPEARRKGLLGTGLGLSIAQEIVQLMGGKIEVDSHEGKGACFFFTIWFLPAPAAECMEHPSRLAQSPPSTPPTPSSEPAQCPPLKDVRVLLAEDNTVTAYYMEAMLQRAGCTVHVAKNGMAALDTLRATPVDVVLLDVRMPEMDGVTVARHVRCAPPPLGRVPIVVLSASMSEEEIAIFHGLDISSHLIKPISAEQLTRAVARAMGLPLSGHCGDDSPSPPYEEPAMTNMPAFEEAAALRDMDNDRALLRRLILLWMDEVPRQWESLHAAVRAEDAASVRRIAHAWKNSAGSLHLMRVRHVCARLEKARPAAWETLLQQLEEENRQAMTALRAMAETPAT